MSILDWITNSRTWDNISVNVIANIIAAVIAAVIGYLFYAVYKFFVRRRLSRFFQINRGNASVRLYVSRLNIVKGGAQGVDPKIQGGYTGPAINHVEYESALELQKLLRSRLLSRIPKRIQEFLKNPRVKFSLLDPSVSISQEKFDGSKICEDVIIVVGSSVYNAITAHYLADERLLYHFDRDEHDKLRLRHRKIEKIGDRPERKLGVVLRVRDRRDPQNEKTVFICAGLRAEETSGCVQYLVDYWSELLEEYKDKSFALCLSFSDRAGVRPSVILKDELAELADLR
jgi:hypothetical protein